MSSLDVAMLLHKSVVHDSRVRREARALAEAGHRVTVIELDADAAGTLDGFRRVSAAPPAWFRHALPFQLYRAAFLAGFLWRLLRMRPDVVHAHDAAMLLPGLIAAKLTGARLVYDSHELATGVPYRDRGWALFVRAVERIAVPRAALVITVTDGIAGRIATLYGLPDRPVVVRNVCDLPRPQMEGSPLRDRLGISGEPLVLHQGAAAPARGCEVLIDAVATLDDVHLAFLGTGDLGFDDALADRAAARGLAERVHFLDSVAPEFLLELTRDADVGVTLLQDTCENHRLALPNKLFEYVAAGVPVVASALPEIVRIVDGLGIGWIVDPADPVQLAVALRRGLGARGDEEMSRRLVAADADLSWTAESRRLVEAYAVVVGARRPDAGGARALVLVRNTVSHDARVHREVEALTAAGWRPVVAGVVSTTVTERHGRVGPAPLVRLAPRSPLGRARDMVRGRREAAAPPPPTPAEVAAERAGAPTSGGSPLHAAHRTLTALDFYRRGLGLVRALRPRLLHCNDWNTMWIGVTAKLLWRIPVVYDAHELWPDRNGRPEPRWWLIACESLFVRAADEVITTSPGYADTMMRRYRIRRPTVVRNVPAEASPPAAGRPPGPPVLVYVGGVLRGRGIEQAISALPHLSDVRLDVIGPGADTYLLALRLCAEENGVEDRVRFVAPVAPSEVVDAVRHGSAGLCLIQPICLSYELTLPNKLFEYAAAGVPVLGSDLPVIAAVVREFDAGEVVAPDDPRSIADGLARLLDPDRQAECRRGAAALSRSATWMSERSLLEAVYARAG